MNSINRVTLLGYLGKDPLYRVLSGDVSTATLYLATSEAYKDPQEQWQQQTEWHTHIVWGKLADHAQSSCEKGCGFMRKGS